MKNTAPRPLKPCFFGVNKYLEFIGDVEPENGAVIIDADIIIANDRYIDLLESTCGDYQRKIQTKEDRMPFIISTPNLKIKTILF